MKKYYLRNDGRIYTINAITSEIESFPMHMISIKEIKEYLQLGMLEFDDTKIETRKERIEKLNL